MGAQAMMSRSISKDANPLLQQTTFYGVITNIIKLDQFFMEHTLFKCDWVDVHNKRVIKINDLVFTMVNMKKFLTQKYLEDKMGN